LWPVNGGESDCRAADHGFREAAGAMIATRITAKGGWIDVSYDGATITMAAVGPPLLHLVKEPASLPARQKRTEERGRYRRMALDALRAAGAGEELEDAELVWSHRAG
jgi:hypothetical protein